jgi:hypothetical protein
VVEAVQWFKNGDHPEDDCRWVVLTEGNPSGGQVIGVGLNM